MLNDSPKYRNRLFQNSLFVSSVPDGLSRMRVRGVQNGCEIERRYAQRLSNVSEWESPRVRECAPLADPANAGDKSGKLGIGKCRADVQNVDMVYAQRHSKVSEWAVPNGVSSVPDGAVQNEGKRCPYPVYHANHAQAPVNRTGKDRYLFSCHKNS